MLINLPIENLSTEDVVRLIELYSPPKAAAPEPWQLMFAELCEALRAEVARRRIVEAQERDPLGYFLFGRVDGYL